MAIAAAVIATTVAVGATVAASQAQKKAASKARGSLRDIQQQQLDFQREIFDRGEIFRQFGEGGLAEIFRRANEPREIEDKLFRDSLKLTNSSLAATGNIRSGAAALATGDLALTAAERADAISRGLLITGTGLSLNQGNVATSQSLQLSPLIQQTGAQIAQTQLATGAANAGLFQGIGDALSGGILLGSGGFGGGGSSSAGGGAFGVTPGGGPIGVAGGFNN